jgi:hypothetical protein
MRFYLLLFHDSHCSLVTTIQGTTVGVTYRKQAIQDTKSLKIPQNKNKNTHTHTQNINWPNKQRYKNGQKLKLCLILTNPMSRKRTTIHRLDEWISISNNRIGVFHSHHSQRLARTPTQRLPVVISTCLTFKRRSAGRFI